MASLLIFVRFHNGRYHGRPEWPPSPARLFQALVAAAAQGEVLVEADRHALAWLESLDPPVIAAPSMRTGQGFRNFVPNNDLDAVGGDPGRVGEIRAPKLIRPVLFEAETPLIYAWMFGTTPEARMNAQRVCAIAERLYQLGRGFDMAWAWAQILEESEPEVRLAVQGGPLYRPSETTRGTTLAVPFKGSLESLVERHKKMRARFQTLYESKPSRKEPDRKVPVGQIFVQPPKARFRQVAYSSPPMRLLFDLIGETASWRFDRIVELTERVRDEAAQRLKEKLPGEADRIHNAIVGRRDSDESDKAARVRIVPLPSIGHQQADRAIRRILVEIPPNCPLRAGDVEWAVSGPLLVPDQGEIFCELALASERSMLEHYGVEDASPARLWRTVTPVALPQKAARRRVDPARRHAEAKGGAERAEEEGKALSAVIQALRHAGVSARPLAARVQREPFEAKGARAEAFASGTRFAKERLWHVEISFAEAVAGPLAVGDGRYLGLGLMAPVKGAWRDVIAFSPPADARVAVADRGDLLRAVRRALMALSRRSDNSVPLLFSGHEVDGVPANSGRHRHIFVAGADLDGDGLIEHFIVAAPWACDRSTQPGRGDAALFDRAVSSLAIVRAGRLNVIPLQLSPADSRVMGPARCWESHTDYHPTRHAGRGKEPTAALLHEVIIECERRGLPKPEPEVLNMTVGPKGGVTARLRLRFATAVSGPLLLGRDSHQGGGMFCVLD